RCLVLRLLQTIQSRTYHPAKPLGAVRPSSKSIFASRYRPHGCEMRTWNFLRSRGKSARQMARKMACRLLRWGFAAEPPCDRSRPPIDETCRQDQVRRTQCADHLAKHCNLSQRTPAEASRSVQNRCLPPTTHSFQATARCHRVGRDSKAFCRLVRCSASMRNLQERSGGRRSHCGWKRSSVEGPPK